MNFEGEVRKALKQAGVDEIRLEAPKNPEFGDLSFACFKLGDPVQKAQELAIKIKPSGMIKKVLQIGPYVNFFIDNEKLAETVLAEAVKKDYGKGKPKGKALIEHTSTNPNASPHVGRARNAILADSLVRILNYYGYSTEVHYFVNDVGKQIAMLVYSIQKNKITKFTFDEMLNMYIKINAEIITNATVEKDVFELLSKLENGNKKTIQEFQKVVGTAVNGQIKLLNELGITYDAFDYESSLINSKILKDVLIKLKSRIFKDEGGRKVLDLSGFNLPMREPVLPLTRANGTSLYALRDIAYHVYKAKKAGKGKNIIVLGEDHKLEHQQIKTALSLMKIDAPESLFYSFILLSDGKMSTRKGNVVMLSDFMNEAVNKAKDEIHKRNPELSEKEIKKLSKEIGYSALKYSILKVSPDKNVVFSWDEALSFEGNSAPYLQYTAVRAKKILEKVKTTKPKKLVFEEEPEFKLIKDIAEFPNMIKECAEQYKPYLLANYAFKLAADFNDFYEKCPVRSETNDGLRASRAYLVKVYLNVITNVLILLGLSVPKFM